MITFIYPPNAVSVSVPPVSFLVDGIPTSVSQDTGTPANSVGLPVNVLNPSGLPVDFATETTQLLVEGELQDVNTELDAQTVLLTSLDGKDFATETTLDLIRVATELIDDTIATDGGPALTKFQTVGGHTGTTSHAWHVDAQGEGRVDVRNSVLPTGAATEVTLAAADTKLGTVVSAIGDAGDPSLVPMVQVGGIDDLGDYRRLTFDGDRLKTDALVNVTGSGLATEAKQDDIIQELVDANTELDGIAADIALLEAKDFATQTTLASVNTEVSEINTAFGAITSGVQSDGTQDATLISLIKGLLVVENPPTMTHETFAVDDTAGGYTFAKPATAVKMQIQNSTQAGCGVRFVSDADTPTAANGFYLEVGQSTPLLPAAQFKAIAVEASTADVTVVWFTY